MKEALSTVHLELIYRQNKPLKRVLENIAKLV